MRVKPRTHDPARYNPLPGWLDPAHRIEYPALRGIWPKKQRMQYLQQATMHPGLGLQPTMPHLPYFTMQGVIGMPLMATLMDVQQMHYPMGLIDYLACGAPAAKKQKAATVPVHLEIVDDYIKTKVEQQRRSVLAPVVTTCKRKRNAKNDEAIIDLFFPPLTYPISQATHSRPTPRTHVSPISSTPRPTPDMPPSPDATRTHTIQSSDICGPVTRPSTKQPDFLTPLDVAPAVHPDAPSTGPCAQPPRHPVHSHSRAANCHTSAPPIRHHWAGCPPPFCV